MRTISRVFFALLGIGVLALCISLPACAGSPRAMPNPTADSNSVQATVDAAVGATETARQQVTSIAATVASELRSTAQSASSSSVTPSVLVQEPTTTTKPETAQSVTEAPGGEPAPAAVPVAPFSAGTGTAATTVNIALIFDASGSMAESLGGETRIDAARRAMNQLVSQLPSDNPRLNVGFRIYGHRGDSSEAARAESCRASELMVPIQGVNRDLLTQMVSAYKPAGWTPIATSLELAGQDLAALTNPTGTVRNEIVLVTDGEETCGGDPCAVAQALRASDAQVRIDVVGLGTTPEQDRNLRCIADNGGGIYTNAPSGDVLVQGLQELVAASVQRSFLVIKAIGPDAQVLGERHPLNRTLTLTGLDDAEGQPVTVDPEAVTVQGERYSGSLVSVGPGGSSPILNYGEVRIELAPGTYRFTLNQYLGGPLAESGIDTFNAPKANTVITYTANVVEGQETVAIVGVGSLVLENGGTQPDTLCQLALEAAVDGVWQAVYAPGDYCTRGADGNGGVGLYFDEYPLLPGRYRLINITSNAVVSDQILIEPGKRVTVQLR